MLARSLVFLITFFLSLLLFFGTGGCREKREGSSFNIDQFFPKKANPERLKKLAGDKNPARRALALTDLSYIEGSEISDLLLERVQKDPATNVRLAAMLGLARRGDHRVLAPLLTEWQRPATSDGNREHLLHALGLLARQVDPDSLMTNQRAEALKLATEWMFHANSQPRLTAGKTLLSLARGGARKVSRTLIRLYRGHQSEKAKVDHPTRVNLYEVLGELGAPAGQELLREEFQRTVKAGVARPAVFSGAVLASLARALLVTGRPVTDSPVRGTATGAPKRAALPFANQGLLTGIKPAVKTAVNRGAPKIRNYLLRAIEKRGQGDYLPDLMAWFPAVTKNPNNRDLTEGAATALSGLLKRAPANPREKYQGKILKFLAGQENNHRLGAIITAGRMEWKQARPPLRNILGNKKAAYRREAALSLGLIIREDKPAEDRNLLLAVVREKSGRAREGAARALGYMEDRSALPVLHRLVLESDGISSSFRKELINSLGLIEDPASIPVLKKVLARYPHLRLWVFSALGKMTHEPGRAVLEEQILKENEKSALAAWLSYSHYEDQRAIAFYGRILFSSSSNATTKVRRKAFDRLTRIHGGPFASRADLTDWLREQTGRPVKP